MHRLVVYFVRNKTIFLMLSLLKTHPKQIFLNCNLSNFDTIYLCKIIIYFGLASET